MGTTLCLIPLLVELSRAKTGFEIVSFVLCNLLWSSNLLPSGSGVPWASAREAIWLWSVWAPLLHCQCSLLIWHETKGALVPI